MLTVEHYEKLSAREQNKLIVACINRGQIKRSGPKLGTPLSTRNSVQTGTGLLNPLIAKSYAPHVQAIKNTYGNDKITKMVIVRTPLSKFLNIALNAASLGDFNKVKGKNGYDDFFHLHLNLHLSSGAKLTLEKTEVVNMKVGATRKPKSESMEITTIPNVTLNTLLDNTQKRMKGKYFTYSASSNNCQVFIREVLSANGINDQKYHTFVKQDTEDIFKNNGFLRKTANTVTDIAASANNVTSILNTGLLGSPSMLRIGGGDNINYNTLKRKELVALVKSNKKQFNRKINVTGMKKKDLIGALNELKAQ